MRRKVISNYLATLHYEAHALDFSNVGERISANGDEVSKFARLDRSDAVLPAQHFCRIGGDGPNHIERWHSGIVQINERCRARFSTRLSGIKPAHIRSRGKSNARLQHSLDQLIVSCSATCSRTDLRSMDRG